MDEIGEKTGRASEARWFVFLGLLIAFTGLTLLAVCSGSPGEVSDRPVVLTTLGTILGPFTGAIARNGQACCLEASWRLAAVCGPILAVGVLAQFVISDASRAGRLLRLVFWTFGWFAWFFGGLISFGHAFS